MPLSLLPMCTTGRLYRRRIDKPAKLRPAPTQHTLPASHVAIPHTKKVFTRIHDTI